MPFEPTNVGRPFPPHEPVADPARGVEPPADRVATPPPSRRVGPIVPRTAPVAARAKVSVAGRHRDAAGKAVREPDVVRVHIGRVEVRAVLPSAERKDPVPKPRETAGPLPLDRFLARKGRP
jgi:hypothetical protein